MADVAINLPRWTSSPPRHPMRIVVLNYYNPFAAWLLGNTALAQQSTVLQGTLTLIIGSAAAASGATVADAARPFTAPT